MSASDRHDDTSDPTVEDFLVAVKDHHTWCEGRRDDTCAVCAIWEDAVRQAERRRRTGMSGPSPSATRPT